MSTCIATPVINVNMSKCFAVACYSVSAAVIHGSFRLLQVGMDRAETLRMPANVPSLSSRMPYPIPALYLTAVLAPHPDVE